MVLVAIAGLAILYAVLGSSSSGGAAATRLGTADAETLEAGAALAPGSLPAGGRIVVRAVRESAPRVDGRVYELSTENPAKPLGDLACKRVAASSSGTLLCLGLSQNAIDYDGIVYDGDMREQTRFPIEGVPDRARVSPDGRFGAYTTFDTRGSESYFESTSGFTTYTRIVDMRTGKELVRLEDLELIRDGKTLDPADKDLWGVTFAAGDRFYATAAMNGEQLLIRGRIGSRLAEVIGEAIECPALSPDGRRIAYKRRLGDRNRWRYHVLDLENGADVKLAETRSIDDQPEWLGNDRILYSDDQDVFVVPADGSGKPHRLVSGATSPTYVAP